MQGIVSTSGASSAQRVPALRSDRVLVPLLVLLHAACAWPTLWIYAQTADAPAVYLASGVTWAGFLLLTPRGQAVFAIGIVITQLAGELMFYDASPLLAVSFALFKTLGPFVGVRVLRRLTGHDGLQATIRDLLWFAVIAWVVVPVVSMLVPHLVRAAEFGEGIRFYFSLVLIEACGIAVMAPLVLFWAQPARVRISDVGAEPVVILLVTLAIFSLVYVAPPAIALQHTPFYAATPVMIWAAARFGVRGAALMNLALTLVMIGSALAGLGPFGDLSDLDLSVIELQVFIMTIAGMTLLLGAYAEAREASRQQRETDKRRLQDLSLRLLESEERYRERIATRLHDGIGQTLSLGRMRLDDVLAPPVNPDTLAARIAPIRNAFDTAISQVRDMTRDVATGLYRGDDIAAAVHQNMRGVFEGSGVDTTVHSEALPALRHEVAVVVSRAVRECLVNVAKHAGASTVRVDLAVEHDPDRFVTVIADNGCGLDVSALDLDASDEASFGLASVRNSMLALGGAFAIDSETDGGTRVTLSLPLSRSTRD